MISERYAKSFCSEDISLIENYEQAIADNTQTWHCHHRSEIQGKFRNSVKLLKKCGLYYKVPAWQLIFLTESDHKRLHWCGNTITLGRRHSKATKQKMKEAALGKHWWNNGVVSKLSKECLGPEWKRGRLGKDSTTNTKAEANQ